MWKRLTGKKIEDIEATIRADIVKYSDEELKFYVGVDSDNRGGKDTYATAIIMYRVGDGGHGYYMREKEKTIDNKSRLWNETYKAVTKGMWLNDILKDYGLKVSEIHADLSDDSDNFSHSMVNACLGYITAMGFEGKVKPYAWAANKCAHRKSK